MNVNPLLQQLLDRLPGSTQELLNAARSMEQSGDRRSAHELLHRAYQRQRDLRFLATIASSLMSTHHHAQAFEILKSHLDEQSPDPNLVILMTETLIGLGNFPYAEQYIEYAARLGAATPRVENLRALLKQRIRERHSGAQVPRDMALDSRIDLTRPELTSLPLADTAFTLEEHANDPTEFIPHHGYTDDGPHTTALESVATHIAEYTDHDIPTMASSASPELLGSMRSPEDRTLEESFELPTTALPTSTPTTVASSYEPHPRDVSDATIPFQRSLHSLDPPQRLDQHDATLHDAFIDDSMDRQVTSYASLQSDSAAAYQNPEIFMPLEEEEIVSKSQVRAAFFGSSQDLAALDPPSPPRASPHVQLYSKHLPLMADPAPSFGARPATSPSTSLSSSSEYSFPHQPGRPQPRFELHAGDRLPRSASSSIELDIIAPPSHFHSTSQPPSHGNPQDASPRYQKVQKTSARPFKVLAIGVPLTLIVLIAIGSFVTDQMLSNALATATEDALIHADDGSYKSSLTALDNLTATSDITHPLGQWAEDTNAAIGSLIPIYSAHALRASISAHQAYHAALIEWRHEAPGSRHATARINTASALLGEDNELLARARIYDLLHRDPAAAFEQAQLDYRSSASDVDFAILMALAAEGFGHSSLSQEILNHISTLRLTQVTQRHQVLMIENIHHHNDFAAHLNARIEEDPQAAVELQIVRAHQYSIDLKMLTQNTTRLQDALNTPDASWHPCFVARIHHAISRAALAEQDLPRTLKSLEQAHTLCPALPLISASLIEHLIHTGEHERAASTIAELHEAHPRAISELLDATLAIHIGDTGRHARLLAPLLEKNHPRALTEDARRELIQGDPDRALAQFIRASEQDAQHGVPMAYAHLVQAMMLPARSKEQDDALSALIKAQTFVSPELQNILASLKLARAQQSTSAEERQTLFASAQRAMTDFIASSQYEDIARYELCELYLAQRRDDVAREACDDAAKINPHSIQGKLARARYELDSGSPSHAKEILLPLDSAQQDYLPLAELLVRTYLSQGDLGVAQKRLNKLINTHPDALVTLTLKGRLAFAQGRYREAADTLQVVADHPSHPIEAQVFLAYARIRTGSSQTAEETLKTHLSHPLWGGYAWLALGELRRREKRFDDAEQNLDKARQLLDHPHVSNWFKIETLTQRALNWQSKHGWTHPQVARYLRQAEALDHNAHADLNYLLGALELSQRRPNKEAARTWFDRALVIDPRHCMTLNTLRTDLKKEKSGQIDIAAQIDLYCK